MRIIPECCVGCIKLNNCEDSHNGELIACSGYVIDPDYVDEKVQRYILQHEDSNQTAKADAGKPRLTLVPRKIIFAIAKIREYGNRKYPEGGPDNYKHVEVERYKDALFRHLVAYLDDPHGVDEESKLPHLWHLACNVAFLCELEDEEIQKGMKDACNN